MEKFNCYFLDIIKNKYMAFSGRASRSEYWYFALFYIIIALVLAIIDASIINPLLGIHPVRATGSTGILSILFGMGLLLPSLAVAIRRLHDIGKSGWWILLAVIPLVNLIGILVLVYFFIKDSQPGSNLYGPNPKEFPVTG